MGLSDHMQDGAEAFPQPKLPSPPDGPRPIDDGQKDTARDASNVESSRITRSQWVIHKLKALHELLTHIPLFGALFSCSKANFIDALTEFTHMLFWATMPFWLGGLVHYVAMVDQPNKDLWDSIVATFRNGELLVFVISAVTPTLYLVHHKAGEGKAFPHALPLSTIVLAIIVVSAVMFSLQKSGTKTLDVDFIFTLSVSLTVVGLVLRYLALVYHRHRIPSTNEKQLRQEQTTLLQQFSALGGQK